MVSSVLLVYNGVWLWCNVHIGILCAMKNGVDVWCNANSGAYSLCMVCWYMVLVYGAYSYTMVLAYVSYHRQVYNIVCIGA